MKFLKSGGWARVLSTAVGLWLMAAPGVLGYGGAAGTVHRIVGPLVASFAVIAIWETTRELRHLNGLGGLILLASPLLFGFGGAAMANSLVSGVTLMIASRVRGTIEGSYAGGWKQVWRGGA